MVLAYIMVKALSGDADRIRGEIDAIEGVDSVNIVAGDVDFIVKVSVGEPSDVKEIATDRIHSIQGVDTTKTYITMD